MTGKDARTIDVVAELISHAKNLPEAPSPDALLRDDLGLSSFDLMALCVQTEERLGAPMDVGHLAGIKTVADLARAWDYLGSMHT